MEYSGHLLLTIWVGLLGTDSRDLRRSVINRICAVSNMSLSVWCKSEYVSFIGQTPHRKRDWFIFDDAQSVKKHKTLHRALQIMQDIGSLKFKDCDLWRSKSLTIIILIEQLPHIIFASSYQLPVTQKHVLGKSIKCHEVAYYAHLLSSLSIKSA